MRPTALATLKAFILGFAVGIGIALPIALLAGIVADTSDWSSTSLELLGVNVWAFERSESVTSTTFGPGLLLIAVAVGGLNAIGSLVLRQIARRRSANPQEAPPST